MMGVIKTAYTPPATLSQATFVVRSSLHSARKLLATYQWITDYEGNKARCNLLNK